MSGPKPLLLVMPATATKAQMALAREAYPAPCYKVVRSRRIPLRPRWRAAASAVLAAISLAGCAGLAAQIPALAARCVSYGASVSVSLPAGRFERAGLGCIEQAPVPGEHPISWSP